MAPAAMKTLSFFGFCSMASSLGSFTVQQWDSGWFELIKAFLRIHTVYIQYAWNMFGMPSNQLRVCSVYMQETLCKKGY